MYKHRPVKQMRLNKLYKFCIGSQIYCGVGIHCVVWTVKGHSLHSKFLMAE